jgi:hypothetical protein
LQEKKYIKKTNEMDRASGIAPEEESHGMELKRLA